MSEIDDLIARVEELKAKTAPLARDKAVEKLEGQIKELERERADARLEASILRRELAAAQAELERVRASMQWTMGRLRIADYLRTRGSEDVPCAEEGFLPLDYSDPRDTDRMDWINRHGRMGVGPEHWLIAIPHRLTLEEDLPTPYNIRHVLDLCIKGVTA